MATGPCPLNITYHVYTIIAIGPCPLNITQCVYIIMAIGPCPLKFTHRVYIIMATGPCPCVHHHGYWPLSSEHHTPCVHHHGYRPLSARNCQSPLARMQQRELTPCTKYIITLENQTAEHVLQRCPSLQNAVKTPLANLYTLLPTAPPPLHLPLPMTKLYSPRHKAERTARFA